MITVLKLDRAQLKEAYNILYQPLLRPGTSVSTAHDATLSPIGAGHCVVPPGGTTQPHQHHECETFWILEGRGRLTVNGEVRDVQGGEVVILPPFSQHRLENLSSEEELKFLSVYAPTRAGLEVPRRAVIASAPPTPNGPLHVGHLSGPYLAADTLTRYLRQRGSEVVQMTGTDDHQPYVDTRARQDRASVTNILSQFRALITEGLTSFGVQPDVFLDPTHDTAYRRYVQNFFLNMLEAGHLTLKPGPVAYSPSEGRFVLESELSGVCPHCEEPMGGSCCENCGRVTDPARLLRPVISASKEIPEFRETPRFMFSLESQRTALQQAHTNITMSARVKTYAQSLLAQPLADFAITQPGEHGIPVPVDGFEGHVIHVWFEMAAAYAYVFATLGERAKGAAFIPCFGFDNVFYYTTFLPAAWLAQGRTALIPRSLVSNEFFRLDGLKFSTSRRHAIWAHEFLRITDADALRLYLAKERPESDETNFVLSDFKHYVQQTLVETWETWIHSLDTRIRDRFPVKIDRLAYPTTKAQRLFHRDLVAMVAEAEHAYGIETPSLRRAARILERLVQTSVEFGRSQQALAQTAETAQEYENSLLLELSALVALAKIAAPLMPGFAADVLGAFQTENGSLTTKWDEDVNAVPLGTSIEGLRFVRFSDSMDRLNRLDSIGVDTSSVDANKPDSDIPVANRVHGVQ